MKKKTLETNRNCRKGSKFSAKRKMRRKPNCGHFKEPRVHKTARTKYLELRVNYRN